MKKTYGLFFLVMALLTPIGLLAEGTAWGEWGADELQETLGFVPKGMEELSDWWQAIFPDYSMPFLGDGVAAHYGGYILSALIGSILIYGLSVLCTKVMVGQGKKEAGFLK